MMALERLALQAAASAVLALGAWLWHADKVHDAREEGRAQIIEAGRKQHALDAAAELATERARRKETRLKDEAANQREKQYAENLAAAERRVRAGDDSLRIAIRTIRATATSPAGPSPVGAAPDGPGAAIVPEVAGDILRLAADTGRVVRNYQRVVERLDACIALNNGPEPVGD